MTARYFIPLIWILCSAGAGWGEIAHAQNETAPLSLVPDKAITQYVHRVWTKADGLPQNAVGAITQTQRGYLWVGTQKGIARFDGTRFTAYNARNSQGLTDDFIARVLVEDREGRLWIGTEEHGLYSYAEGTFTHHGQAQGLTGQQISAVLQDRRGRLWVGTHDRGLFVRTDSTFSPYPIGDASGRLQVSAIHGARGGALWVGTGRGVFVIRSDERGTRVQHLEQGLPHPSVTTLHEDRRGRVWIGTRGGLSQWVNGAIRPVGTDGGPGSSMILAIAEDRTGAVWIGTDYDGLYRHHERRIERFTQAQGLSHNRVTALHVDREGSLWIGTGAGGLNQLYNGKFTTYGTHEGLSSDRVLAVFEAADRSLWVGTDGAGVNRLRGDEVTTYTRADGLSGSVVTSLGHGSEGDVWVGTYGSGVNRFRDGVFTAYTTNDGLPSNNIFALQARQAGGVWVGTDEGLAAVHDDTIRTLMRADGRPSRSVSALLEDEQGTLWVGTYDDGLSQYKSGRFIPVANEAQLGARRVLALHKDDEGVLWIGTYGGGLVRLNGDTRTRYTSEQGLPHDRIYQILEDDHGNLWLGSDRGIFRLRKDRLNAIAREQTASLRPTLYSSGQGGLGEMNGGFQPAGWAGQDGRLWFPTDRGVVAFDPDAVPTNTVPPMPHIEQVRVDGKPMAASGEITVPPGTERIQIRFNAPSFVAPAQMQFRYILDGFSQTWHTTSTRRTATYTNLDPGTYSFRVRAANNDGVWSPSDAVVTIIQQPHFYQARWFHLLGLIVLGGVIYGGYRLRLRQLHGREQLLESQVRRRTEDLRAEKEKTEQALAATEQARQETEQAKAVIEAQAKQLQKVDRIKTEFFNNLSHEFRTPLTLTIGPLENVLAELSSEMPDAVRRRLSVALRNARRLLRLINQILDFSKLDAGKMKLNAVQRDLVAFVEGVVFSFSAFAQERGIDLRFESACETAEVYYDPEKLERVLFNLLSNAVKFTPAGGCIDVALVERGATEQGDDYIDIRVQDSGPGIPEEDQSRLFDRFQQVNEANSAVQEGTGIGLSLAKELVELHGGRIGVESEEGEGTTFIVSLRRGRGHLDDEQIARDLQGDSVPSGHRFIEMVAADASDWASTSSDEAAEADPDEEAPTILVVDDNADLRAYVRRCLEPAYRMVEAQNGAVGLERARDVQPDLILSDVMMPGMDGHALCQALKKDAALNRIPIIMLTAKASSDDKVVSLEQGADDYVAKPFNAEELRARIRNLLTLREHERTLQTVNQQLEAKVEEQVQTMMAEREAYEAQLREEKERAETAARMKSAILNNMSHELRTPMASILGYAQILMQESDEQQREFARFILQSGERLMGTLNDILELSKLEAKAAGPATNEVDAVEVVNAVADEYVPAAAEKGIALRRAIPSKPLLISLDAPALKRVVDILVENAIKFTTEGHVRVEAGRAGASVYVRVEDTGIGISKSFRPELFEPFHQERMDEQREHQGEGLGLSIAKRLVDTAEGTIDVESTKGEGTQVTVRFPAHRLSEEEDRAAS